jgi:hypothetical protein
VPASQQQQQQCEQAQQWALDRIRPRQQMVAGSWMAECWLVLPAARWAQQQRLRG